MQTVVARRRRFTMALEGRVHATSGNLADRFLGRLPYQPTKAQCRTIGEIYRDLASKRVMNRLLQGDVGAGKTLVATASMLYAVEAGFQAVLMAPTQVLAEQHYRNLLAWLAPLGTEPRLLIRRLETEPDVSARRALILALGEYGPDQLPGAVRQPVTGERPPSILF